MKEHRGQRATTDKKISGRALKNHRAKEETMSLNRKAMVMAVGAALAAPGAYAQVKSPAGTGWEFYGKFYPEETHSPGDGAALSGPPRLSPPTGNLAANLMIPRREITTTKDS